MTLGLRHHWYTDVNNIKINLKKMLATLSHNIRGNKNCRKDLIKHLIIYIEENDLKQPCERQLCPAAIQCHPCACGWFHPLHPSSSLAVTVPPPNSQHSQLSLFFNPPKHQPTNNNQMLDNLVMMNVHSASRRSEAVCLKEWMERRWRLR